MKKDLTSNETASLAKRAASELAVFSWNTPEACALLKGGMGTAELEYSSLLLDFRSVSSRPFVG